MSQETNIQIGWDFGIEWLQLLGNSSSCSFWISQRIKFNLGSFHTYTYVASTRMHCLENEKVQVNDTNYFILEAFSTPNS